jgi:4-amino-4-deoxy-L-arabinose transferase-like glycosyltransferase
MMVNRGSLAAVLACVALGGLYAATAHFAWSGKCATFDEPVHLASAWAQTHDSDFYFDAENPPLWKYFVAVGTDAEDLPLDLFPPRPAEEVFAYRSLYERPGVNSAALINGARARMILLAVGVAALIAWWAWRLAGPLAGTVALAFFCMDPNFLAHGPLVKNDVPMTLSFVGLMAAIWLLGESATIGRLIATCLLLGVALNVKFSGALGIPMLAAALLIRALLPQPWPVLGNALITRGARLAAAGWIFAASLLVAYNTIWACYDFRFVPGGDGQAMLNVGQYNEQVARHEVTVAHQASIHVPPDTLAEWEKDWHPHGITSVIDWMNDQHFLPQGWLMGFLYTYAGSFYRPTFLCGELGIRGWWYYFPLAMAFKTPLATLGALLLAATTLGWWQGGWKKVGRINWPIAGAVIAAAIAIPILLFPLFHAGLREYLPIFSRVILGLFIMAAAGVACWGIRCRLANPWPIAVAAICPVVYMAVAMDSHMNLGLRHVLPVYPFLFIFLGVAAAGACRRWPRAAGTVVALIFLGLATETFTAYPNYIPFFNAAVGGSRGGLRLLSDSNIDWGQELPDLARWQQAHPNRPLYLYYFGTADPNYYKIDYTLISREHLAMAQRLTANAPAVFAISAVALQGTYLEPGQADELVPFRRMQPFEILGGSLYLFDAPASGAGPP